MMIRLIFMLCCFLVCAAPVDAALNTTYHDNYSEQQTLKKTVTNYLGLGSNEKTYAIALITGVDRYPLLNTAGDNLEAAKTDLKVLRSILPKVGFNEIIVLWNADFTQQNIEAVLRDHINPKLKNAKRARFLYAHSGHGATINDNGYLLYHKASSFSDTTKMLSLPQLRNILSPTIKTAFHSLALLNSCYGGSFMDSFGGRRFIPRHRGAHAITAGGSDEKTWGTKKDGSVFFERVARGLSGAADSLPKPGGDGVITSFELYSYLKQTIQGETNHIQNPKIGRLTIDESDGEFFFIVPKNTTAAYNLPKSSKLDWLPFGSNDLVPYRGRGSSDNAFTKVTLLTSLPEERHEKTVHGGSLDLGILFDSPNNQLQFQNVSFKSAPVHFNFTDLVQIGFAKPIKKNVSVNLEFEVMIRLDRLSGFRPILSEGNGQYRVEPLYSSECVFSCYDIEFYGDYRIVVDGIIIEGRINSSNTGRGVGADLSTFVSPDGLPMEMRFTNVRFHGNHNFAQKNLNPLINETVNGVEIRIDAPFLSFQGFGNLKGTPDPMVLVRLNN